MEDEFISMDQEINENYNKTQLILNDIIQKESKLGSDLEKLKHEQEKLNNELSTINSEIEIKKEKIDNIINDNGDKEDTKGLSSEDWAAKCKQVLSLFINEAPKGIQTRGTLFFNIKYANTIIVRQIDDDSMTFHRLKQETKLQFDKHEDEYYYADEDNKIYLDELNVKKALFPLGSVNIKGYMPVIRVIDKKSKSNSKENVQNQKMRIQAEVEKKVKLSKSQKLKKYLINNIPKILPITFFGIFLSMWILSCFYFRNVEEYIMFVKPFSRANFTFSSANVYNYLYKYSLLIS